MASPRWIDNDHDFEDCCRELRAAGRVAVDTEFVWTSTFYARLGLIQLASGRDNCALVDATAVTPVEGFRQLLASPETVKVLHEAASDLPILAHWCGGILPSNIHDTRLAGGFAGLTAGCSLNQLLSTVMDILLPKTETRSDWLQRPLTTSQLAYAADDVALLPELSLKLEERIAAAGNLDFFHEEMLVFSSPDYYAELPPDEAWKRIGGAGRLNDRCRGVLRELAAWRETTARQKNRTRRRIVTDGQLLIMAQRQPATIAELKRIPEFWPKQATQYGNGLLAAIRRGQALTAAELPPPLDSGMPSAKFHERLDRLTRLAHKRAEARQIDSVLVCPKRRAAELVVRAWQRQLKPEDPFFKTWQATLLGPALHDILFD